MARMIAGRSFSGSRFDARTSAPPSTASMSSSAPEVTIRGVSGPISLATSSPSKPGRARSAIITSMSSSWSEARRASMESTWTNSQRMPPSANRVPIQFGLRRVAIENKDAWGARFGGMLSILVVQILQPLRSNDARRRQEVGWHYPGRLLPVSDLSPSITQVETQKVAARHGPPQRTFLPCQGSCIVSHCLV